MAEIKINEKVIEELIEAAEPFLSGDTVDETDGTIPLMNRLEKAIEQTKKMLKDKNFNKGE